MKCAKCTENLAAYFISRGGAAGGKIGFCEGCAEDIGIFAALRKVESLLHGYGVEGEGGMLFAEDDFPVEFAEGCRRCGTDLRDFERRFCFGCEECAVVFGSLISNYLSLFGAASAKATYPGTPPVGYVKKRKACGEAPGAPAGKLCEVATEDEKSAKSCAAKKTKDLTALSATGFEKMIAAPVKHGSGSRIVSCVELRRNFADMTFPTRMTPQEMEKTFVGMVGALQPEWMTGMKVALRSKPAWFDARVLEAKMYGRKLYPGATVASNAAMSKLTLFNNMDHLTFVSFSDERDSGKALKPLMIAARYLEERTDIAYSGRFGFLTAAPKRLGSGLSVFVVLHLPYSLFMGKTYEYPRKGIEKSVRFEPLTGNNFEQHGFFRVSSTLAFGRPEQEVVEEVFGFAAELEKEEETIKNELAQSDKNRIVNLMKTVTRHAEMSYRLSYQDALRLTSFLQLGVNHGAAELPDFEMSDVIPGLSSMFIMRETGKKLTVNECEKERAERMAAIMEKWSAKAATFAKKK